VKYVNYIDGDSKTFKEFLDVRPYEDIIVNKRECIMYKNAWEPTKGLGGKGKLIAKLIDDLTKYYSLAIHRNCMSIEAMKNDIWAIS